MASWAIASNLHFRPRSSATPSAGLARVRAAAFRLARRRHGGCIPRSLLFADRIGLQRDVYYGVYAAAVTALFVGWSRDTGSRCVRLRVALEARGRARLIAAGAMAFIATRQDVSGPHPGG